LYLPRGHFIRFLSGQEFGSGAIAQTTIVDSRRILLARVFQLWLSAVTFLPALRTVQD
jgi:hypothetical protein